MNALVFLYKKILKEPLHKEINAVRAPKKVNVPVVMSREETARVISFTGGTPQLVVKFMYGSGLRISEAIRLRVQDIDYELKTVTVRSGKGAKDRITTSPSSLTPFLQDHLSEVKRIHENGLNQGYGEVYMPYALHRKYPNAAKEWNWQYVFLSGTLSRDPRSGVTRRHHIDPSVVNKAIKAAVRKAGLTKKLPRIRFGTVLPPLFYSVEMISGPSRRF
jgi:integrase